MLNRNQILKIYGTDYREMTKILLEKADLQALIPGRETRIAVKPNLVCPTPADFGATTHPEVVAGIVEYLQEHYFSHLSVIESSWVGDKTSDAYEYCGYREICERYGVPFVDVQKRGSFAVDAAGLELNISDAVKDFDFLINVPVLKGHCQTKMTCALKNMKGLIPNTEKRRFHKMGLMKPIAHLNTVIHQDFVVVDHICGDLDFEEGGNPVTRNCVMAAADPVLADSYACSILGITAADVPYVKMAEQLGVGSADLTGAEILRIVRGDAQRRETEADVSDARMVRKAEADVSDARMVRKAEADVSDARMVRKAEADVSDARMVRKETTDVSDNRVTWKAEADTPGVRILRETPENGDRNPEQTGQTGQDEDVPARRRVLDVSYAVDAVDSCSACYGNLIPALYRLKEEGLLQNLHEQIAIGQGHQGKRGKLGVGKCTRLYDFCVMGCPPDEETIYRHLRDYITKRQ